MYKTVKIAAIVVGAGTTGAVAGAITMSYAFMKIVDSNEVVAKEFSRMLSDKISDVLSRGMDVAGRKVFGPGYGKRGYIPIKDSPKYNRPTNFDAVGARLKKSSEYGRPTVAPVEREEKDI